MNTPVGIVHIDREMVHADRQKGASSPQAWCILYNGFLHWTEQIGTNIEAVVRHFLTMYAVEQQGYKACMALMKLTEKYPPERLESACRKALSYTPRSCQYFFAHLSRKSAGAGDTL